MTSESLMAALHEWVHIFVCRSMRDFILYAKENGLSASQLGALFRIGQGACGVSDLGNELGITSAAASQLLQRLVQEELVVRSEDPHDRRGKRIALTDKGKHVLRGSICARQRWLDDLPQVLTDEEQEHLTAALHVLVEKANQLEREPPRES